jgi:hypothetical protein
MFVCICSAALGAKATAMIGLRPGRLWPNSDKHQASASDELADCGLEIRICRDALVWNVRFLGRLCENALCRRALRKPFPVLKLLAIASGNRRAAAGSRRLWRMRRGKIFQRSSPRRRFHTASRQSGLSKRYATLTACASPVPPAGRRWCASPSLQHLARSCWRRARRLDPTLKAAGVSVLHLSGGALIRCRRSPCEDEVRPERQAWHRPLRGLRESGARRQALARCKSRAGAYRYALAE